MNDTLCISSGFESVLSTSRVRPSGRGQFDAFGDVIPRLSRDARSDQSDD